MKQWTELYFILTKDDGTKLELGTDKYPIVKDNALFQSLTTFESSEDEREIPIEVYINNAGNIKEFGTFFEMSNRNQKYKLEVYFNNQKYNATVIADNKPFEVGSIEDLYGTLTQPTATVKIVLIMESPFFYSDYSYDVEIGATYQPLFEYPLPYRLNDDTLFVVSKISDIIPHIVDNQGNENNGIIATIEVPKLLVGPRIINDTTDFVMGFNLRVSVNSIVVINTIEKTVCVNGIYSPNVKQLFDKWLTLERGKNVIHFEADAGADSCRVQIQFYNKYRAIG